MTEQTWSVAGAPGGRTVRVFVSSTFRDLQRERDELAKFTFPQLRRRCAERGVTWSEVDLRWGITAAQIEKGEVLSHCFDEIERSRPYFIGILGERYGSVQEIAASLVEAEPWLADYAGCSVTELEIMKGVLRNPDMASHAFFYLRDPAYLDTRPADEQPDLREMPSAAEIDAVGYVEAERRAEGRRSRLRALKECIRGSGLPVRSYPDPRTLGELVLADLSGVIDRLYPEGSAPDALAREADEHEAFAASRADVYVGRAEYRQQLDDHAAGDGPPLVVVGESGVGKSALLANWARTWRVAHPGDLLVMHFVGGTPSSGDWTAMLRRVVEELGRHLGLEDEISDEPEALRLEFARRLCRVAAHGRAVIVIDALEQLEDRGGALDLTWLPPVIPANVRLLLSSLPGRPLDEVARRGWPTLRVLPLTNEERATLIGRYLGRYAKALSPALVDRIAAAPQTANPLYLRALLEELRLWGVHETIAGRIEHYLAAETISALYQRILARYEADYENERPGLVGDAMSLLWAARRGLSETELRALLGSGGEPLPSAFWTPLSLAAERSLVNRSGLIGFSHRYVRRAIEERYLHGRPEREAIHLQLADYFDARRQESRAIDELAWQLGEATSWQRLAKLLADLPFLERAFRTSESEVKAHWASIEANSSFRLTDAYRSVVDEPQRPGVPVFALSKLLSDTGHLPEARGLLERFSKTSWARGDSASLRATLLNLAVIVERQGDLDAAMALLGDQERICREAGDLMGLHRALGNRAGILLVRGALDEATTAFGEQERICREIDDRAGLAGSLGNQAVILARQGRLDAAMSLHKEEERICRELDDRAGVHRSLANQATIYQVRGELDAALVRYRELEEDCRELGDPAGLHLSLGNQATILVVRGNLDAAMTLLREQERICRELGDLEGLHRSLGNQAVIHQRRGDLDTALAVHIEAERICRELGDQAGLHLSLGNQGQILKVQGQPDRAMSRLREQERICRELGDQAGLQDSLGNQATILLDQGQPDRAMSMLREQERICRDLGHRAGLAISLGNQSLVLRQRGDIDQALALVEQVEQILREIGDVLELAKALVFKGVLLSDSGRERNALASVQEAHRMARQHGLTDLAEYIEQLLADLARAS